MSAAQPPLSQHYIRQSSGSDADTHTPQHRHHSNTQKLVMRFTLHTGERHALNAEYDTLLSILLDKLWTKCHIQNDQSYYVIRLLYGEIYFQSLHKISQIVKISQSFNEQYINTNPSVPLVIDLLVQPSNDIGHNISRELRFGHAASGAQLCSSAIYRVNKVSVLGKQYKKQYYTLIDITLFIYDSEQQYKSQQPAIDWISMSCVQASILNDTSIQHKQYNYPMELNCDCIGKGIITILCDSESQRQQWLDSIQLVNMRHTKSLCIAVCEELVARGTRNCGIKTEGIFRISGNKDTVSNLHQQYSLSLYPRLSDVSDDHALAGLLKLALRQMAQPLLTYTLYTQWLSAAHINDTQQRINKCVELSKLMPASNYYFTSYLMYFLSRVAHYSATNMMHSKNLSVVIAPNILKPEHDTVQSLSQDNQYVLIIVQTLIDSCHTIWPKLNSTSTQSSVDMRSQSHTVDLQYAQSHTPQTVVSEPSIDVTYLSIGTNSSPNSRHHSASDISAAPVTGISLQDTIQSLYQQLQQLCAAYNLSVQRQQLLLQQLQTTTIPQLQQQQLITILSSEINKKQSIIDTIHITNLQLKQLNVQTTPINTMNNSSKKLSNSTSYTYLPPPPIQSAPLADTPVLINNNTNTNTNNTPDSILMPAPRRAIPPPLPVLPRCISASTPINSHNNTPHHSPIRDLHHNRSSNADQYESNNIVTINTNQCMPLPFNVSRRASVTAPNAITAELKALHASKQLHSNNINTEYNFNTASTAHSSIVDSQYTNDNSMNRRGSAESMISPAISSDIAHTPSNTSNTENNQTNINESNSTATTDHIHNIVPAIAKFNYQSGQRKLDITLTRGDTIDVDEQDPIMNGDGWLHGINRNTGESGYFPKTYVKLQSIH